LAGKYGEGSYTEEAITRLWNESIRGILVGLNPQQIIDYLATKLDLPIKERPAVSIKGIQAKKGIIIVSLIGLEGKEQEAVIPVDFIKQVQSLLGKKLLKELPPIPLLGNGS